jgi:hypothetical protein
MTRVREDELQESISDLCNAVKLLAVVAKSAGYASLHEEKEVERMSRDVEQVCNLADKALQRLVRDTGSLAGYPEGRTGDLAGE